MDTHEIEPVRLLLRRLEELHFAITKRPEETLVTHIAHSVHSELCAPFLQKDWLDLDVVALMSPAVVVHKTTDLK